MFLHPKHLCLPLFLLLPPPKERFSLNRFSDATPLALVGMVISERASSLLYVVGPRWTQRPLQTIDLPLMLHL